MSEKKKGYCPPCAADATFELGKDICKVTTGEDKIECNSVLKKIQDKRKELSVKETLDNTEKLKGFAKKYNDTAGINSMTAIQDVVKEIDSDGRK